MSEVYSFQAFWNFKKQEAEIYSFLQGAVYCWCKNFNDKEFALRDLMGGENFEWTGTPLYTPVGKA